MVVKQAEPVYDRNDRLQRDMKHEGEILELYAKIGSKHIIRQYGTYHTDQWEGKPVTRIYLEFCPSGTIDRFLRNTRSPIEEGDIWRIFHCLSLAVSVMHRGTEWLDRTWQRDVELVHFE